MDLGGLAKDLFQLLQSGQLSNRLVDALGDQRAKELKRLVDQERSERPPKVAVVGKAGVGKTTTVNNLFSASFRTSHALTGTKEAQLKEYELQGGGLLHVLDLPGLGEGVAEDEAFEQIYRNELPHTDLVLYVLEAGERILGEDQRILRDVIIPSLSKVKTEEGRPRRLPISAPGNGTRS
jgi:predicted GTPase